MEFSKREANFLIVIGFGFVPFLIGILAVYEHYQYADYQPAKNSEAAHYKGPVWTDVAIAIYTYFLVAATYGMWYIMQQQRKIASKANDLLNRSNETAALAVKIAKESADAFILVERGILEIDKFELVQNKPGEAPDIHYLFRNVGRTPALLFIHSYHLAIYDKGAAPPLHYSDELSIYDEISVPAGKTFGVNGDIPRHAIIIDREKYTKDLKGLESWSKFIYIQGSVVYRTVTGIEYWNRFTWWYDPSLGAFTPFVREGYNHHNPWAGAKFNPGRQKVT